MFSSPQDHSMYFHDTRAIPIPSPHPQTPPPITHLVLAQDAQLAADHLQRLTISNPSIIPHVVTAIRRHLLPRPTRFRAPSPHHAPFLLHRLVLTVPYFYRYLATPHFLRALLRLVNYAPASHATRLLFAGWARDLKHMGLEQDPAAAFWIVAADKVARKWGLPSAPVHRRFVYPVSELDEMCFGSGGGCGMTPDDVAASMRLLEQLGAAKKRRERGSLAHLGKRKKSAGKEPEEIRDAEERKGKLCRLNTKVLSVLRRHGDLVTVGKGEAEKASVAKVARDNARRKLWESHGSLSVGVVEEESRGWKETLFEEGTPSWGESRCWEELEGVESAFTPSTFARMEVRTGGGSIGGVVSEEDMEMAIESVGDTVKLPEVEGAKGLSIGKRLMMKMMAGGRTEMGDVRDGSTVGSSSSRLLLSKPWAQDVY